MEVNTLSFFKTGCYKLVQKSHEHVKSGKVLCSWSRSAYLIALKMCRSIILPDLTAIFIE